MKLTRACVRFLTITAANHKQALILNGHIQRIARWGYRARRPIGARCGIHHKSTRISTGTVNRNSPEHGEHFTETWCLQVCHVVRGGGQLPHGMLGSSHRSKCKTINHDLVLFSIQRKGLANHLQCVTQCLIESLHAL